MQPIALADYQASDCTDLPVTVVLERRPAQQQRWVDHFWSAVAVVSGYRDVEESEPMQEMDNGIVRYLVSGLRLHLYPDECESYYHNMMSPRPSCYVVAHVEND